MEGTRGSLWSASVAERVPGLGPPGDGAADLVIVGGGYTGASAALEAAAAGAKVVLLEAGEIGQGGSGRNVGLVNAGLWMPPEAIAERLGAAEGARLSAALGAAPERVFSLIDRHGIACEARRSGTLHCAHAPAGLRDLEARFRQQNRLGAPVRLLDAAETAARTGTTAYAGALFDARAGTIQPLGYARGLARAAADAGAAIHEQSPVTAIRRKGGDWCVETAGGTLRAGRLLVATNAYHRRIAGQPGGAHVPVHYFQVATGPLGAAARARLLPGGEGCWDTALVMSSFRTDAAGRLILGGIGNLEGPAGRIHAGWARRKIARLFPWLEVPEIAHAWCGRIAMTGDHLPRILRLGPGGYACFGYSGRGIGPGTVFGTALARALLSGDEDALPLRPVSAHAERFTGLRAGWYEAGAALTHALGPRGRPG